MTTTQEQNCKINIMEESIKSKKKYKNKIIKISLISNISSPTYPNQLDPKLLSNFRIKAKANQFPYREKSQEKKEE